MIPEICFDILDDLSDELGVSDFYHFLSINDLVNELTYRITRKVEYYYEIWELVQIHSSVCNQYSRCACVKPGSVVQYVCLANAFDVLKWLHFVDSHNWEVDEMVFACIGGHLEIAKWLRVNRPATISRSDWGSIMAYASIDGHIHIVDWIHSNYLGGDPKHLINYAVRNGHHHMVRWIIHKFGSDGVTGMTFRWASMNGHLDVLKWLCYNTKVACPPSAMNEACQKGHKMIASFLHEEYGWKIDQNTSYM